jgi:isopenicillin-N epimerase
MAAFDESIWALDPALLHLNHGSFGACPRPVLAFQSEIRARIEAAPTRFYVREFQPLLDAARAALAAFVGADPEDLVFVPNATTGVNTVVRSLDLGPGDELLTTDHAYNACRNALEFVAARSGARVVVAPIPFPVSGPEEALAAVLGRATDRTRIALVDHVTSPTALVLPLAEIVAALAARGVDTLVDGAHAPGQLALDVAALGAAWYTGNCHKWLCAPKGAGFLWTREDRREAVHPLVVSHGHNVRRPGRSAYHDEFDWQGTDDPTAFLSVPEALRVVGAMVPGGWPEVRERNHRLALEAQGIVATALGIERPCPATMVGTMAAFPLPPADGAPEIDMDSDPLHLELFGRYAIEAPVFNRAAPPHRLLRVSAQLYNEPEQYERLAAALRELLPVAGAGSVAPARAIT